MVRAFIVGAVVYLSASVDVSAAYFQSTTTWIGSCQRPIENSEAQRAEFVNTSQPIADCYAYLMAIADALDASVPEFAKSVGTSRVPRWDSDVRFPADIDQEKLRQAFLSYAERHPDPALMGTSPAYVAARHSL